MKDTRTTIIKNLSGRVTPVNFITATHGVQDLEEGLSVLNKLIHEGVVETTRLPFNTPEKHITLPGYRMTLDTKLKESA